MYLVLRTVAAPVPESSSCTRFPGLTPKVIAFADEVVDAGFAVVLPQLFGEAGAAPNLLYSTQSLIRVCIRREFTTWRLGRV